MLRELGMAILSHEKLVDKTLTVDKALNLLNEKYKGTRGDIKIKRIDLGNSTTKIRNIPLEEMLSPELPVVSRKMFNYFRWDIKHQVYEHNLKQIRKHYMEWAISWRSYKSRPFKKMKIVFYERNSTQKNNLLQ